MQMIIQIIGWVTIKKFSWMEDRFWIYKTSFNIKRGSNKYYFVSKGIDYEFEIYLNDEHLLYQEGMYRYIKLDISDKLKEQNEIIIKIFPVPKLHLEPINHVQASQSCKPAASYGWDWHPRLIPLGIWDETYIEEKKEINIRNVVATYTISEKLDKVKLLFDVELENAIGNEYYLKVISPSDQVFKNVGEVEQNKFKIETVISEPALWFPIGYGKQNLYSLEFWISDGEEVFDVLTKNIGLRTTKLIMNEGAWKEPNIFPKTRSVPPIQLEINGIKVFCMGSNWVMPEIFYGIITGARYKELIDLAVGANFNILRLWGGAIINKESFYEYCDKKGLMIWQEFPLACNNYFDSEKYLKVLESESFAIIERIKQHPCLALWSGGNELFNEWSGMTDQSKALRLQNKLCFDNDPDTPYIPTSPLMGMGHGHYVFHDLDSGKNVFDIYPNAKNTAHTEFGVGSPSSAETIEKIIDKNELWPPKPETTWEDHHAFNAWVDDTWLSIRSILKYFGEPKKLKEFVDYGQTLQAVGLQFIYEESRRQKPYCSMAINWCFSDCWPSAANTSIIEYPNVPKKAYYSVQKSCRPILASARVRKFVWSSGEKLEADLFILNDSLKAIKKGRVVLSIKYDDEKKEIFEWEYTQGEAQKNLNGPTVKYTLPKMNSKKFYLLLEDEINPRINSKYLLLNEK